MQLVKLKEILCIQNIFLSANPSLNCAQTYINLGVAVILAFKNFHLRGRTNVYKYLSRNHIMLRKKLNHHAKAETITQLPVHSQLLQINFSCAKR